MTSKIGPQGEGLVFLLGVPRSGTTLLSVMLEKHPDIAAPAEPWLMLALAALGRVPIRHPANSAALGTAVDSFLGEAGVVVGARAAARAIYQQHLDQHGARVFVDKTPRYALILDFLISVFPRARFIWLQRDPMDVAASYLTTWKCDLSKALIIPLDIPQLFDVILGLDRLIDFQIRHSESIHVVQYERLVANPRREMASVLAHIGLHADDPMIETMIEFGQCRRDPAAFGDSKILETTEVHTNSVARWKTVLTRDQLQILINAIGNNRMAELGYMETVSTLNKIGIFQRDARAPSFYKQVAEKYLQAREMDIKQSSTFNNESDGLINSAQLPVNTLLAADYGGSLFRLFFDLFCRLMRLMQNWRRKKPTRRFHGKSTISRSGAHVPHEKV
jgi:hypothetical protein